MYLTHYGFKKRPFGISPDPSFLWLGEKHSEGLAALRYGILKNKGFLLLTGDIGTGKTVLLNRLIRQINLKVNVATIPDPNMEPIDFCNILADEFKLGSTFTSKGDFLIHFKRFLVDTCGHHKKALLIIDEAQRLDHGLLEQIRLLSNIEFDSKKLINIFLVGQSELRRTLLEERNKSFRQRIAVNYHIEPLNALETASYIEFRLKVAGSTSKIFSTQAISEIHSFSQGYPRLINIICDHALMSGYAASSMMIDADVIKECASELQVISNADVSHSTQPTANQYEPPAERSTVIQDDTSADQPQVINYIDIPEKRSYLKVAGIYAIFFIVFVLSLALIFNSSFEHYPRLAEQVNDILISGGIIENRQKESEIIIMPDENTEEVISDPTSDDTFEQLINMEENYIVNEISENAFEGGQSNILADFEDFKARLVEKAQSSIVADSEDYRALPEGKGSSEDKDLNIDGLQTSSAGPVEQSAPPIPTRSFLMSTGLKFIVYFSPNSTGLTGEALEIINTITKILARYPDARILIEGYGGPYDNYRYNQKLSHLRANVVKSYLVRRGVAKSRVKTAEMRSTELLGANALRQGKIREHQVDINVKIRPVGAPEN